MKISIILSVLLFWAGSLFASPDWETTPGQSTDKDTTDSEFKNWHHADPKKDKKRGISTNKAYQKILKGKKSKTVIVGIIDSGVDIDHEDLQGQIWVNEDEIPGNGIDDDNNGYIDDIHGWNFLGNPKGENIRYETLEITRLYRQYKKRFEGKTQADLPAEDQEDFERYQQFKEAYEKELKETKDQQGNVANFAMTYQMTHKVLSNYLGKEDYSMSDLDTITSKEGMIGESVNFMTYCKENNISGKDLEEADEHFKEKLDYNLNLEFNPRTIVGDDPHDINDNDYGNNDVKGLNPDHGTHVAGIIGAVRGNNKGLDGVADNVKLMIIRTVPDGDERDKDVAKAIEYAVNNGAQVVNMSFGKNYAAHKEFVDNAIRLAEEKGVLLIHAAGNDAENNDKVEHYPTNEYEPGKFAKNWITVGASSMESNEEFVADFSNYGQTRVDVFAPGVDIYSLKPGGGYVANSGTSMACPVVTGLAALIMSYYPELSAEQVKNIILESAVSYKDQKVNMPSQGGGIIQLTTKFGKLSATGGLVNAYQALKLAKKTAKKMK